MVTDKENTEEKILDAAKEVFVEKGKDGARMQEIANKAGINKSLLHYYYRSKDKLFAAVFKFAFKHFIPKLTEVFNSDDDFFEMIRKFVALYIDILSKNPVIPMFILNEVSKRKTDFIGDTIKKMGVNPREFKARIELEIEKGVIKEIDTEQLIVNILSMCVFPFVARPLLKMIIFDNSSEAFEQFIEKRRTEVADFIINSIKTS